MIRYASRANCAMFPGKGKKEQDFQPSPMKLLFFRTSSISLVLTPHSLHPFCPYLVRASVHLPHMFRIWFVYVSMWPLVFAPIQLLSWNTQATYRLINTCMYIRVRWLSLMLTPSRNKRQVAACPWDNRSFLYDFFVGASFFSEDRLLGGWNNRPGHLWKTKAISMRKLRVSHHVLLFLSTSNSTSPRYRNRCRQTNPRTRTPYVVVATKWAKHGTRSICLSRLYFALNRIQGSLQIDKKKKRRETSILECSTNRNDTCTKKNKMKKKHSGVENRKWTIGQWMESRDSTQATT